MEYRFEFLSPRKNLGFHHPTLKILCEKSGISIFHHDDHQLNRWNLNGLMDANVRNDGMSIFHHNDLQLHRWELEDYVKMSKEILETSSSNMIIIKIIDDILMHWWMSMWGKIESSTSIKSNINSIDEIMTDCWLFTSRMMEFWNSFRILSINPRKFLVLREYISKNH